MMATFVHPIFIPNENAIQDEKNLLATLKDFHIGKIEDLYFINKGLIYDTLVTLGILNIYFERINSDQIKELEFDSVSGLVLNVTIKGKNSKGILNSKTISNLMDLKITLNIAIKEKYIVTFILMEEHLTNLVLRNKLAKIINKCGKFISILDFKTFKFVSLSKIHRELSNAGMLYKYFKVAREAIDFNTYYIDEYGELKLIRNPLNTNVETKASIEHVDIDYVEPPKIENEEKDWIGDALEAFNESAQDLKIEEFAKAHNISVEEVKKNLEMLKHTNDKGEPIVTNHQGEPIIADYVTKPIDFSNNMNAIMTIASNLKKFFSSGEMFENIFAHIDGDIVFDTLNGYTGRYLYLTKYINKHFLSNTNVRVNIDRNKIRLYIENDIEVIIDYHVLIPNIKYEHININLLDGIQSSS